MKTTWKEEWINKVLQTELSPIDKCFMIQRILDADLPDEVSQSLNYCFTRTHNHEYPKLFADNPFINRLQLILNQFREFYVLENEPYFESIWFKYDWDNFEFMVQCKDSIWDNEEKFYKLYSRLSAIWYDKGLTVEFYPRDPSDGWKDPENGYQKLEL